MGKIYKQNFRNEWLSDPKFKDWLLKVEGDDLKCYCDYCNCYLASRISDIERHGKTTKHHTSMVRQLSFKNGGTEDMFEEKLGSHVNKKEVSDQIYVAESEFQTDDSQVFDHPVISQDIKPTKKRGRGRPSSKFSSKPSLPSSTPEEELHEIDIFAKSIAAQMKMLPERHVLDLFSEFQNLVTKKRQRVLEEKSITECHGVRTNSQVITVTIPRSEAHNVTLPRNEIHSVTLPRSDAPSMPSL